MSKKKTELKQDPKNARKHSEFNKELIQQSFDKLGAGRSGLADADGYMIAGNQSLESAELAGKKIKVIPTDGTEYIVLQRTDLKYNDKRRKELAIVDNSASDSSTFIEEVFEDEYFDEVDIEDWGVTFEEENEQEQHIEAREDDFEAPLPKHPVTVKGDLYELISESKGLVHRVHCGDSTNVDDVTKLMNGKKSEMLFTSPPYSDMREYNGGKDLSVDSLIDFIPTFLPFCEYQVVNLGIKRQDNEIVPYWDEYINKAKDCGYKFLSWNIWNRQGNTGHIANQTAIFGISHEWIFVFGKKTKRLNRTIKNNTEQNDKRNKYKKDANGKIKVTPRKPDGSFSTSTSPVYDFKQLNTVFDCQPQMGRDKYTTQHSAPFPVKLPLEYIKAMTNEGDIVTESFLGSGTTLIASEQTNRHCYGQELDEKYCDVIISRWIACMEKEGLPYSINLNGKPLGKKIKEKLTA